MMKRIMVVALTMAAFGCWLLTSAPAREAAGQSAREYRKTVEFEPGGELVFDTDKGSVKLTAWERSEVAIYARIVPPENESEDYGRRAVEAAKVEVFGDTRSLTVRSNFEDVPYKSEWGGRSKNLPDIHYEIQAPRDIRLRLSADRSRVSVNGFAGRVALDTDRTEVEAGDLAGEVQIKVDRGRVRLADLRGSLDLETDRTDSRVQAIQIEGDSRLDVSRGEAELSVPASQGLAVSARVGRRETFRTDFEIATRSFGTDVIEGSINGGGPRLAVRGDRSRVYLRRQ
jgi:hypothetical protein